MRTYWQYKEGLSRLDNYKQDSWIEVTCPTPDDRGFMCRELGIPYEFLDDVADRDERSRYDFDDDWALIILRIPYSREEQCGTPHTTVPLGVFLKDEICVTVCHFETDMMQDFVKGRNLAKGFTDSVDLVFRLFLASCEDYLSCLKKISIRIEEFKRNLDGKIDNADLIRLSRLQDSLTYFITSIKGNETLLAKLKFKLPVDELDEDLIEDVNIEMNQALETTSIYTDILASTLETYASIINNNMSGTMKQLTSFSIVLMFPTLVASIFGMNLLSGIENDWWGFPAVIILTIIVTWVIYLFFRRKKWM